MRSNGYDGVYKLMYNDGVTEVKEGDRIQLEERQPTHDWTLHGSQGPAKFHEWIVYGGRAPHTENSSGRIEVKYDEGTPHTQEWYPHVVGTKWVKV